MRLTIDNEENISFISQGNITSRSSRQIADEPSVIPVRVYIGGAENSAMFNGCIKYPFISRWVVVNKDKFHQTTVKTLTVW